MRYHLRRDCKKGSDLQLEAKICGVPLLVTGPDSWIANLRILVWEGTVDTTVKKLRLS